MGYMSIEHLYKHPDFFKLVEKICVMEKIHGTSTWIEAKGANYLYHSGGETSDKFRNLFNQQFINNELSKICGEQSLSMIRIHGETYGHKQQKMKDTYGDVLRFVVFEVKVIDQYGEYWLNVSDAEKIAARLKLDFVPYVVGPNTIDFIEKQTNLPSVQAEKNGMGINKLREGVVVKPFIESFIENDSLCTITMNNGTRPIFKHKCGPFWETKKPGMLTLDESKKEKKPLTDMVEKTQYNQETADNWITNMRAEHVLDKMLHDTPDPVQGDKKVDLSDIKSFSDNMIKDVEKESVGEIEWSPKLIRLMRIKSMSLLKKKVLKSPDDPLWSIDLINKLKEMSDL
jgi:hypothetical protein